MRQRRPAKAGGRTDPRQRTQDKARVADRYDVLASGYLRHYVKPKSLFALEKQRRTQALETFLAEFRPSKILDLGCGPGYVASRVAQLVPQTTPVGLDLSESMIRCAQANFGGLAVFARGDLESLPFPSAHFDLAYALGVLDKFEVPHRAIQEAHRVLRVGGVLFFTYPNKHSVLRSAQLARYLGRNRRAAEKQYLLEFQEVGLLLQQAGFHIFDRIYLTYGNGVVTLPWTKAISKALEKLIGGRELGRALAMTTIWIGEKR